VRICRLGLLTVEKRRLEQRPRGGDFGRQIEPEREHSEYVLDLLDEVFLNTFGLLLEMATSAVGQFGVIGGDSRDVFPSARGVQQGVLDEAFEQTRARTVGGSAPQRAERPFRNGITAAG